MSTPNDPSMNHQFPDNSSNPRNADPTEAWGPLGSEYDQNFWAGSDQGNPNVANPAPDAWNATSPTTAPMAGAPAKGTSKGLITIIIVAIVFTIIGAVSLFFIFFKPSNDPAPLQDPELLNPRSSTAEETSEEATSSATTETTTSTETKTSTKSESTTKVFAQGESLPAKLTETGFTDSSSTQCGANETVTYAARGLADGRDGFITICEDNSGDLTYRSAISTGTLTANAKRDGSDFVATADNSTIYEVSGDTIYVYVDGEFLDDIQFADYWTE